MKPLPRFALIAIGAVALALPSSAFGTSTFTVTTGSDPSGGTCLPASCTLRQAVAAVNAGAGGDTITIPAGTYPLVLGQLVIQKDATVTGAGAATTIIDGLGLSRIFDIPTATTVTISGVTVQHGLVTGTTGAEAQGGGIRNAGTLNLNGVTVRDNTVTPAVVTPGLQPEGGGIYNTGALRVSASAIEANRATTLPSAGGIPKGGGISNFGGQVALTDTTVSHNVTLNASGIPQGGGISSIALVPHGAAVTLTRTVVNGNQSIGTTTGGIVDAGGVLASRTDLTVRDSAILANRASGGAIAQGGGILMQRDGDLLIERSLLAGNGIDSSALADGGGIFIAGELVDRRLIQNSTITANAASAPSGGSGGGVRHNGAGRLDLISTTIAGNTVVGTGSTGGNLADLGTNGGLTSLRNAIVADGAGLAGSQNCGGPAIQSAGHNIDSLDQCAFHAPGDKPNTAPLLSPLADNGGPTRTMAIDAGSPALDAADTTCAATDQRGITRPQRLGCDIGAFEFVPTGPATLTVLAKSLRINVRTGRGNVAVRCDNVIGDLCNASVVLSKVVTSKVRGVIKRKTVKVGTAALTLDGASAGTLKLTLTSAGLALLKKATSRKLLVTATTTATNKTAQTTITKVKITLTR